uniref:Elf-1_N domain-containing protein n=1 Tax=Gongylonema pulchrum TaxID=637853 RepID=A0A183EJY8_9BILA
LLLADTVMSEEVQYPMEVNNGRSGYCNEYTDGINDGEISEAMDVQSNPNPFEMLFDAPQAEMTSVVHEVPTGAAKRLLLIDAANILHSTTSSSAQEA